MHNMSGWKQKRTPADGIGLPTKDLNGGSVIAQGRDGDWKMGVGEESPLKKRKA